MHSKLTPEETQQRDCARERLRNYLEDNEIRTDDFGRRIGRSDKSIKNFLAGYPGLGAPALHEVAKAMGITYAKLISPLTATDYLEDAK